jgi:hypothetical protein
VIAVIIFLSLSIVSAVVTLLFGRIAKFGNHDQDEN